MAGPGTGVHGWRVREPEFTDGQLELGRLFDGEIARFGALQDLVRVDSGPFEHPRLVGPVGHEQSCLGKPQRGADRRKPSVQECAGNPHAMIDRERIMHDEDGAKPRLRRGFEDGVQVVCRSRRLMSRASARDPSRAPPIRSPLLFTSELPPCSSTQSSAQGLAIDSADRASIADRRTNNI